MHDYGSPLEAVETAEPTWYVFLGEAFRSFWSLALHEPGFPFLIAGTQSH